MSGLSCITSRGNAGASDYAMLFNSFSFIFGFLPVALMGFFALGCRNRNWALNWIICASLIFYAWWRPLNVLLIAPSILINYGLARLIGARLHDRPNIARFALGLGILFNLGFLGYFKYAGFFEGMADDLFGLGIGITNVILPLGISFITFQKIAFLVDVYSGRVASFTARDYTLFVLFFPQLIAGPIVHYREVIPQFHAIQCRFRAEDVAIGLALFSCGLFKKVILADSMATYASPIYASAAHGAHITLFYAWIAALGFTLQVYFDFAGYSEMALGLARFFGVKLPANFNSPLKAASIIEFWQRWHMTLTRFLTAYLYNPLVMALTRRRLAKGRSVVIGRQTSPSTFVTLLAFPTLATFVVCGLWHGAGYQYVIWGFLHGMFLTINQGWRLFRRRYLETIQVKGRLSRLSGCVLTFFAVVAAVVIFRAPTLGATAAIWKGMLGESGVAIPQALFERAGVFTPVLQALGVAHEWSSGSVFILSWSWIVALLAIAWGLPNTLEVLKRHEPALGFAPNGGGSEPKRQWFEWRATTGWAVATSVLAATSMLSLGRVSEFLYWQF